MARFRNDRLCRPGGWGRSEDALPLSEQPKLAAYLSEALGGMHEPPEVPPAWDPEPPESRLSDAAISAMIERLGDDAVSTDDDDRIAHSQGRSYRDLLHIWSGHLGPITDAVVYPGSEEEVAAVLRLATEHDFAVVPFGGGTSVVGGVDPLAGPHATTVTLDTMRLNHVHIDPDAQLADIGAGVLGPDLERRLSEQDYLLGHFPQSFEFSTFGGWVATRGAGQQSTRYGNIARMVSSVRIVTPEGTIRTRNVPASAAGPSLVQQLVGSEGTLGVITSAVARIRRRPEASEFSTFLLGDFESATALVRDLAQAELPLSVVRLSDANETRFMLEATASRPTLMRRIGKAYVTRSMRRREFDQKQICVFMVSVDGDRPTLHRATRRIRSMAELAGALYVGAGPGRNWEKDRFRHPYLRDELLARRVMVDTLETATTWSNVKPLYESVQQAIHRAMEEAGSPGVVLCHLSHVYPSGTSLYYTFLARQKLGGELEQWKHVKQAANAAIVAGGGTLTHHHGVGNEHVPLSNEHGSVGVAALEAAKKALDPGDVMNPDKLYNTLPGGGDVF